MLPADVVRLSCPELWWRPSSSLVPPVPSVLPWVGFLVRKKNCRKDIRDTRSHTNNFSFYQQSLLLLKIKNCSGMDLELMGNQ